VSIDIPCVGAIVIDAAGRLLVIQRGQPPAEGLWSIPGGRVEPGESARAAAVREVMEETGIAISISREVGTVIRDAPGGGRYVIRDFLAEPRSGAEPLPGDDARDARYVSLDELLKLPTTPGLIEALTEWQVLGLGSRHGTGSGNREPEGRRGEDHNGGQPGGGAH